MTTKRTWMKLTHPHDGAFWVGIEGDLIVSVKRRHGTPSFFARSLVGERADDTLSRISRILGIEVEGPFDEPF